MEVCPKDAISLDRTTGKSIIDQEKCIKCGRCASVCSYNAIIVQELSLIHILFSIVYLYYVDFKTRIRMKVGLIYV